ncbi:hypothetical protein WJX84_007217, partial [Apatococcus fuscideae]
MTRLAHQKQLDQRSEAEQKVHTVTLLLNGLRRKHEQQLAEADEQPKLEAAPIGKAVQKLSGSARKELDAGLQAMGADPKLSECARKDWERSRLATLAERFFNPAKNAGLPRWAYTSDVHRCLEAAQAANFEDKSRMEQESWVEHKHAHLEGEIKAVVAVTPDMGDLIALFKIWAPGVMAEICHHSLLLALPDNLELAASSSTVGEALAELTKFAADDLSEHAPSEAEAGAEQPEAATPHSPGSEASSLEGSMRSCLRDLGTPQASSPDGQCGDAKAPANGWHEPEEYMAEMPQEQAAVEPDTGHPSKKAAKNKKKKKRKPQQQQKASAADDEGDDALLEAAALDAMEERRRVEAEAEKPLKGPPQAQRDPLLQLWAMKGSQLFADVLQVPRPGPGDHMPLLGAESSKEDFAVLLAELTALLTPEE